MAVDVEAPTGASPEITRTPEATPRTVRAERGRDRHSRPVRSGRLHVAGIALAAVLTVTAVGVAASQVTESGPAVPATVAGDSTAAMQAELTRLQNLAAAYADDWTAALQAEQTRLENLAGDAYADEWSAAVQAELTRLQNLAGDAYADEWSAAAQAELTRLQNLAADAYAND